MLGSMVSERAAPLKLKDAALLPVAFVHPVPLPNSYLLL